MESVEALSLVSVPGLAGLGIFIVRPKASLRAKRPSKWPISGGPYS